MPDSDAVLHAAFAAADIQAMMRIWADQGPVSVIHPGTLPVVGRAPVLQSWRDIFAAVDAVDIVCLAPQAQMLGDVAMVLCQERVHGHLLAASNTYREMSDGWKLVMHQAGSVAGQVAAAPSSVVH